MLLAAAERWTRGLHRRRSRHDGRAAPAPGSGLVRPLRPQGRRLRRGHRSRPRWSGPPRNAWAPGSAPCMGRPSSARSSPRRRRPTAPEEKAEHRRPPPDHVEVKVVDPATDRRAPPVARSGEICARGYQVMTGYLDMPNATAETIDADGWVHTGDLGDDGRARLRPHHRPDQGHDHPRRGEHLPAGDRGRPRGAPQGARCRGRRTAEPRVGRERRGSGHGRRRPGGRAHRHGAARPPARAASRRTRHRSSGTSPTRSRRTPWESCRSSASRTPSWREN